MHMLVIVNFCFIYLIIFIVYCFVDIDTYDQDESPQQDEEMEKDAGEQPAAISRPIMPCRTDRRVHIELEDCICALFSKEDVPHAHIREIKYDPDLFDIWRTLPCDMTTLMHHVVGALTLIQSL